MEILTNAILFVIGITLLYYGADYLVRGGANIARILGIQPIVIGLTIVAFGTSMPELLVGIQAALKQQDAIAIGNVVGSNIANIGLILGLSALVTPIVIHYQKIRKELIFLTITSIFFSMMVYGTVYRYKGIIFLIIIVSYTWFLVTHPGEHPVTDELPEKEGSLWKNIFYILLSLIGLKYGSDWLIESAVFIARKLDIPEMVIGMTIVAVGTSLPELAASVVAAAKKEADISIGNIIGSNIFNMFFVIGGVSLIRPLPVNPKIFFLEIPVMLAYTAILFPILFLGKGISRRIGGFFVIGYIIFTIVLFAFRQI